MNHRRTNERTGGDGGITLPFQIGGRRPAAPQRECSPHAHDRKRPRFAVGSFWHFFRICQADIGVGLDSMNGSNWTPGRRAVYMSSVIGPVLLSFYVGQNSHMPQNMKKFRLTTALFLLAGLASAAPQQEELRFLNAVRSAYSSKDKDAIVALQCWDGVNKNRRELFRKVLDFTVPTNEVLSVQYRSNYFSGVVPTTKNGVVYVPNLTPIKHIQIEYKTDSPKPGVAPTMYQFVEYYVGEKNGKLLMVQLIPQQ